MKLNIILKLALANLGRVKTKTGLAMLGIAIGCAAVVLLVSLGIGAEQIVSRDLLENFTDYRTITVVAFPIDLQNLESLSTESLSSAEEQYLFPGDLQILKEIEGVQMAYAPITLSFTAPERSALPFSFRAIPSEAYDFRLHRDQVFYEGSGALPEGEITLSSKAAQTLGLNLGDSLTASISVPSSNSSAARQGEAGLRTVAKSFIVTTIYKSDALEEIFINLDEAKAITAELLGSWPETEKYNSISVEVGTVEEVADVARTIVEKGYFTFSVQDLLDIVKQGFQVVNYVLGAIGGVALLVALFGIANTMVMTVLERTREIGLLKALGMSDGVIRILFLVEAGMIGLGGGLLGLLGGWSLSILGNDILKNYSGGEIFRDLFVIKWWLALGVLLFAILVSMLAGLAPAVRASRIDPVRALRSY